MRLLLVGLLLSTQAFAETFPVEYKIKSISLFRNEVQLELKNDKELKVGSKLLAKSATIHKCLLIIKKIDSRTAYADASQCPGFATLKKGQSVEIAGLDEVNEEVRVLPRYSKMLLGNALEL